MADHVSYLDYVRTLAGEFPRLQVLADYMSPEHRISDFHSDDTVARRMTYVDVTVLDVCPGTRDEHCFDKLPPLIQHLDAELPSGSLRIIIVESVSRDIIQLLGEKFALDPRFFENHVRSIEKFLGDRWTGDRTSRLEASSSECLSRDFLNMDFVRPYVFDGWPHAHKLRSKLNVPRFAKVARNFYLEERVSVYKPVEGTENSYTSIILCDPLIDHRLPGNIHLRTQDDLPTYNIKFNQSKSLQKNHKSTRSVLVRALIDAAGPNEQDVTDILINNVLIQALGFLSAAIFDLGLFGSPIHSRYCRRPKDTYNLILKTLNSQGGWIDLDRWVESSLIRTKATYLKFLKADEVRDSLELEIKSLQTSQEQLRKRSKDILDFIKQEQEIALTGHLERLSKISFFFVPLSTIATILSVPSTGRLVIFAALAVPISILCMVGILNLNIFSETKTIIVRFASLIMSKLLWGVRKRGALETTREVDVEGSRDDHEEEFEKLRELISKTKTSQAEKSISYFMVDFDDSGAKLRRRTTKQDSASR